MCVSDATPEPHLFRFDGVANNKQSTGDIFSKGAQVIVAQVPGKHRLPREIEG